MQQNGLEGSLNTLLCPTPSFPGSGWGQKIYILFFFLRIYILTSSQVMRMLLV